jgi:hypothetical protein
LCVAVRGGGGGVRKSGPIMAVPKPINLPSRKAENNGFDPNLQLVPGGSWGAGGARPQATGSTSAGTNQSMLPKSDPGIEGPPLPLAPSRAPWSSSGPAPGQGIGGASRGSSGTQDFPRLLQGGQSTGIYFDLSQHSKALCNNEDSFSKNSFSLVVSLNGFGLLNSSQGRVGSTERHSPGTAAMKTILVFEELHLVMQTSMAGDTRVPRHPIVAHRVVVGMRLAAGATTMPSLDHSDRDHGMMLRTK